MVPRRNGSDSCWGTRARTTGRLGSQPKILFKKNGCQKKMAAEIHKQFEGSFVNDLFFFEMIGTFLDTVEVYIHMIHRCMVLIQEQKRYIYMYTYYATLCNFIIPILLILLYVIK